MTAGAGRSISLFVGTDHHPFSRLVGWADAWAAANSTDTVTIQYGHSRAPAVATGFDFMDPEQMHALIGSSDVVITHGGPATIADARGAGHLPLVMPRDPAQGEHVDDHQQRFSRWSDARGLVTCVGSLEELDSRVSASAGLGTRVLGDVAEAEAGEVALQLTRLLDRNRKQGNKSSAGAPVVLYAAATSPPLVAELCRDLVQRVNMAVIGDTRTIWEQGILRNNDCSCGAPFMSCEFWQETGKLAFGGWANVDVDLLLTLRQGVESRAVALRSTLKTESRGLRMLLTEYSEPYYSIYSAVKAVSGADVVLHTDTDAYLALALSHNREIDLRYIDMLGVHAATGGTTPAQHRRLRPAPSWQRWMLRRRGIPEAALPGLFQPGVPSPVDAIWSRLGFHHDAKAAGPQSSGMPGQHIISAQSS